MSQVLARVDLDQQMRVILAKLELVSNGTTVSYNSAGGSGGESADPRPRGGSGAAHLFWAREYGAPFFQPTSKFRGADSDHDRREVIERATKDWETLTGHGAAAVRPAGETAEERNVRIAEEGEGYTIKEAAIKFRCGERDVRRARVNAGRDPDLGKPPIGTLSSAERRRRAAELRADGRHSVAAIALLLKVSKETVKRDLRHTREAA